MQHYGNGNIKESKEEQRQTHGGGNINYYYQCTMNVNSFNVHDTTMEDCYNNIPVTRSSFSHYFCPHVTSISPFCY